MPQPLPPWPTHRDPDWPLPDRPDHPFYAEVLRAWEEEGDYALVREVALNDFWFFCRHILTLGQVLCLDPHHHHYGKPWLDHPWLFARCREIQADPNGFLDLWPRFHWKTALITQSLTEWDLADNPKLRFAFISYKIEGAGEGFLDIIINECESNPLLHFFFPDTFFFDPQKESPLWTKEAITLRRPEGYNPKEPTITVASLRSSLTSFHVEVRVWDDLVTEEGVRTSDAIDLTTERFQNFAGIAADFVVDRATGTHWAVGDTWEKLLRMNRFKKRYHDIFEEDGETPVLRSREWCDQMHRDMSITNGEFHWMCVMRNRPDLGQFTHFRSEWWRWYEEDPLEIRKRLNVYIIIDTAKAKLKESDFTVLSVVGLGAGTPYGHFYVLDLVRDRLGLVGLTEQWFRLVDKWRPTTSFIEEVAMARDSEHVAEKQRELKIEFDIVTIDDKTPKVNRIEKLDVLFKPGRIHFPRRIDGWTDGRPVELVQHFRDTEYLVWTKSRPSKYDDILDNLGLLRSKKVAEIIRFPERMSLPDDAEESSWRRAKAAAMAARNKGRRVVNSLYVE